MPTDDEPAFKHLEELIREYHVLIITADSILISLPLIGLSVLASVPWIPHFQLGIVGGELVISVVLFGISLVATFGSVSAYLQGAGIYVGALRREKLEADQKKRNLDAKEQIELLNLTASIAEGIREWEKRKMIRSESLTFFYGGLVMLLSSLVTLVVLFLSG